MNLASGQERSKPTTLVTPKRLLNAGSGPSASRQTHALFDPASWQETRLDIDPTTRPDILGSFADMRGTIEDGAFDAVWSSHAIEHLHTHEVPGALSEFRRVLKPTGFALLRCPDLEVVVSLLLSHGPDNIAYNSPLGPVTPLDMLFGHSGSIARGRLSMAHHTGFTAQRLGQLCLDAGFSTVMTKTEYFDLWAVALMEHTDRDELATRLALGGLTMHDRLEEAVG